MVHINKHRTTSLDAKMDSAQGEESHAQHSRSATSRSCSNCGIVSREHGKLQMVIQVIDTLCNEK